MIEINLKDSKAVIESELKKMQRQGQSAILCAACTASVQRPLDWSALFHVMDGFFWRTADETFEIIGLCPIASLSCRESAARFQMMKEKWAREMLDAVSLVDRSVLELSFPLTFGAFSFYEREPHQKGWAGLPENLLVIPEFLCIRKDERTAYILQVKVTGRTTVEEMEEKLRDYARLFQAAQSAAEISPNAMIKKEAMPFEKWQALVEKAKQEIAKGSFSKVVLARETQAVFEAEIDVPEMLKKLYMMQRGSYIFLLKQNGKSFIGATPERLVQADGHKVYSACIAGTQKRGQNAAEDDRLGTALLQDDKNLREHRFVVEKVAEIMRQFCGIYTVSETPMLLKNKFLQHLYTPVFGELKEGVHLLSAVEQLHPTPALGGVPREVALSFLQKEENLARGWYGAPIGWMDREENGEFVVGIRSGLVNGKHLTLFSGCGIVADSDAQSEYEETDLKLRPMLASLGDAVKDGKS